MSDPNAPMWQRRFVPLVVRSIRQALKGQGYMVALYGSIIQHGDGRDLDVMLVPWRRTDVNPLRALNLVQAALEATPRGADYRGELGTLARVLVLPSGHHVDLVVREVGLQ